MKRKIFTVLVLVLIASIVSVPASAAAGSLQVHADMSSMESFTGIFEPGLFYIEDGVLYGYSEAKALQTRHDLAGWYVYDTSVEVCFADDDMTTGSRGFAFWYCNTNLDAYGRYNGTNYMRFNYDIDNREFVLTADDPDTGENVVLAGPVPYELSDNEYHTLGFSVSEKRIRGFVGDKLVIDYYDEEDKYMIGLNDEYTYGVPLVWWNDGNYIMFRDIKVSTPGYLYPFEMGEVTTEPDIIETTDNSGAGGNVTTKPKVTTTSQKVVEITDESGNTVTDDAGNAVTSISIVTEAPAPADTNGNTPAGGNSASTGDTAFAVAAVMIITLGAAVVIKRKAAH